MKKNLFKIINLILVILTFIEGIWAYSQLPEKVPSHWNYRGEVDGHMSRFGGAFFLPIVVLGLYLLLTFIPKIDPKKENRAAISPLFTHFITAFLLYMMYIYTLTIAFGLGHRFDVTRAFMPAFGGLFYFIGWMLPRAKPNWFMGIRTPWTLSNDEVWRKTHNLGGILYKICGILAVLGVFFPRVGFFFIIIPVLISTIYLLVYSYLEYRKLQ